MLMYYRKYGKILEEGVSGFFGKKVVVNDNENVEVDWGFFNKLFF